MPKKKEKPKDKRARLQAEKAVQYKNLQAQAETQHAAESSTTPTANTSPPPAAPKVSIIKSAAKANGLKSLFVVEDEHILTSFGKGNKAEPETVFTGEKQKLLRTPGNFEAEAEPYSYSIVRGGMEPGHASRPTAVPQDLIGAKDALEQRYFGKTFNDNIHIQLIYNILDIEKLLAEYIDSIIYSLNNVTGIDLTNDHDIIGFSSVTTPIQGKQSNDFTTFLSSPRLGYFGGAFFEVGTDVKASLQSKRRRDNEIASMLELLGSLRQFLKHGQAQKKVSDKADWLYLLDNNIEKVLPARHRAILNKLYDEKLEALNKDFLKVSRTNLAILFEALDIRDVQRKREIACDYYLYIVPKEGRNLGFTLKTLRERIVDEYPVDLRDKEYDSVRSKLYRLFDFVLFLQYKGEDGSAMQTAMVESLRAARTEQEKDAIYQIEAHRLWTKVENSFQAISRKLHNTQAIKSIQADKDVDSDWIEPVRIKAANTSTFSKLMYMLTLFLDGKEINILLSSLINKFENIQSFLDVLQQFELDVFQAENKKNFSFFLQSDRIARELRSVKSFARMEAPMPAAKWAMFEDALRLLGLPVNDYERLKLRLMGEKQSNGQVHRSDTSLRNFLANNVLESSRFRYLIRFADAAKARQFAECEPLVRFVLNGIPETQIDRYYEACADSPKMCGQKTKIDTLTHIICQLNFSRFENVRQRGTTPDQKIEKQQLQAILSLYLTVLYLITKNLVNINARYSLAIHCLERDTSLLKNIDIFKSYPNEKMPDAPSPQFALTDRYIQRQQEYKQQRYNDTRKTVEKYGKVLTYGKRFNDHGLKMVMENRARFDQNPEAAYWIFKYYRNAIAHLSAVTAASSYVHEMNQVDSYFAVYHYAMQRYLGEHPKYIELVKGKSDILDSLLQQTIDTKYYRRDLLWALNAPFAYNLPRYKSLSIADLFGKNEQPPQKNPTEENTK